MSAQTVIKTKKQLAKAVRMLEYIHLVDMNGHISYRLPGTEHILINSRKASRSSLTEEDIVTVDLEGNLLTGTSEPPSEIYIHTNIYKKRSDVGAVIHGHPHWQTVLTIADVPLQPVFLLGSFIDSIPVYEKSSLVNTQEMGEELSEVLGHSLCVQLRHHGSVVVGNGIEHAFALAVCLEENAHKQYCASLLHGEMKVLHGENLARTKATSFDAIKIWTYYERKAEKEGALSGLTE